MQESENESEVTQSCLTLSDPMHCSPPGSSVPGVLQARTLEWVAISFSNAWMHAKSLQSCPTLCDPMDSSPPGSSVHRILQARILEWVAISFSNSKALGPGKVPLTELPISRQTSSVKGQIANIFGLMGLVVSVATLGYIL